ncbi:MAG: hypothetical protein IJ169_06940 [Paludibacteraceae bacterium]|nr:hypothetical protein [Paludibacteraceae bacterium]
MKRFLLILSVVLLAGCHSGRRYFPADITPQMPSIVRFDSALISLSYEADCSGISHLFVQYPDFMSVFSDDIIGIPIADTALLCEAVQAFLGDTTYGFRQTNDCVMRTFADIDPIRNELAQAFGRMKYLYADFPVPEITFVVTGFNASLFFWDDNRVAVGTDMYLGSDYPLYNGVVHRYQMQTMRPECIPADVISACLFRYLPYTSTQSRLLENMLYRGKIMFLLSLLLPDEPAWEVMGYTQEQWQWAERNEAAVWRMMVDKHDLFKTDSPVLTSYLNDGPFTSEISQEAPARLGTWIGWRIAESYMNHNPEVTLCQLMAEPDAQLILEQSFYHP